MPQNFSNILNASPTMDPYLKNVLKGGYLGDQNPYLGDVANQIRQQGIQTLQESLIPQQMSNFAGIGRYGSNAFANALSQTQAKTNQAIGGDISNLYSNAYSQERGLMGQALSDWLNQQNQARGVLGGIQQSQIGARAQLGSARISANSQQAINSANLERLRNLDYYNAARDASMTPYNILGGYGNFALGAGGQGGQGSYYGQQINPWAAGAQGAVGGFLGAYGAGLYGGGKYAQK